MLISLKQEVNLIINTVFIMALWFAGPTLDLAHPSKKFLVGNTYLKRGTPTGKYVSIPRRRYVETSCREIRFLHVGKR